MRHHRHPTDVRPATRTSARRASRRRRAARGARGARAPAAPRTPPWCADAAAPRPRRSATPGPPPRAPPSLLPRRPELRAIAATRSSSGDRRGESRGRAAAGAARLLAGERRPKQLLQGGERETVDGGVRSDAPILSITVSRKVEELQNTLAAASPRRSRRHRRILLSPTRRVKKKNLDFHASSPAILLLPGAQRSLPSLHL
ncbi:hypothetical protein C2845_PM02G16130 [Panicum miliaceum]|uniref:Uncharacterized protein n=1 Tax=Panicum miliaceum TaxID=4540 RepID=A0A3L6SBN2_PANMI|nr:hypothetical protein C2845_PM02G16130 [Panicum miliaceum]